MPTRSVFLVIVALVLVSLTGCAREQKEKRPVAGDIISVLIYRPKTWREGAPATVNVRLRIEGPSVATAEILRDPEVPHDQPPIITIAFLKDQETIKVFDKVAMKPDC